MPKLSLKVFQAQIEPILMYGSEVLFIGKEILDFETVHLSFLKNMLGVKQQTTSVTIYGDTGSDSDSDKFIRFSTSYKETTKQQRKKQKMQKTRRLLHRL